MVLWIFDRISDLLALLVLLIYGIVFRFLRVVGWLILKLSGEGMGRHQDPSWMRRFLEWSWPTRFPYRSTKQECHESDRSWKQITGTVDNAAPQRRGQSSTHTVGHGEGSRGGMPTLEKLATNGNAKTKTVLRPKRFPGDL